MDRHPLTDHDRVYVARNELPDNLVNAFIAREDEAFFDHGGIVYSSIIRSICRNLTTLSYAQGASTITMQLARNCYELGEDPGPQGSGNGRGAPHRRQILQG